MFIWGLCLFGTGALLTWPCLVYRSFGGFCAATFIIGNGLGSLETAANPYREYTDSIRDFKWVS